MTGVVNSQEGGHPPFFMPVKVKSIEHDVDWASSTHTSVSSARMINVFAQQLHVIVDVAQAVNAGVGLTKKAHVVSAVFVDLAVEDSPQQANGL